MSLSRRRFMHQAAGAVAFPALSQLGSLIADETEKWARVIKLVGIKAE